MSGRPVVSRTGHDLSIRRRPAHHGRGYPRGSPSNGHVALPGAMASGRDRARLHPKLVVAIGEPYALEGLTLEFPESILGRTRSCMKERYSSSDVSLRAATNGLMSSVATYRN